jgi:hypothetical protein
LNPRVRNKIRKLFDNHLALQGSLQPLVAVMKIIQDIWAGL